MRHGNMNPEVHVCRYVTESTFDAHLYQTVENKQKFISQIMSSKSPVRSCEDVDETALSYAEIKALCAGNPLIKEKMDLDIEVARLRLLKADHQSQHYRLEDELIRYFPQNIEKSKEQIAGFEGDKVRLAEGTKENADGFSPMVISGTTHTDKGKAGAALIEACNQITSTEPVNIGSYRGFDMNLSFDTFNKSHKLTLKGTMSYSTDLGTDTFGNITRINNALGELPERLTSVQSYMENLYQQMENAKIELQNPFPLEQELTEKSERLAVLDAELNMDKGGENLCGGEQLGGDDDVDIEVDVAERVSAKGKPSILDTLRAASGRDKPLDKAEREKAQDTCL